MDWSKVKSIMIVLFLILNIFLLILLYSQRGGDDAKGNAERVAEILESQGCKLESDIPDYSYTYLLNYKNCKYDKAKIAEVLLGNKYNGQIFPKKSEFIYESKEVVFDENNIIRFKDSSPGNKLNINNTKSLEANFIAVLKRINPTDREIKYDTDFYKNEDGSITLIFREIYEQHLIYNSYAYFTVSENGLSAMTASFVDSISFRPEKIKNVMPAYKVMLKNLARFGADTIKSIDRGYMCRHLINAADAVAKPSWIVRMENTKNDLFFNIKTGELETDLHE